MQSVIGVVLGASSTSVAPGEGDDGVGSMTGSVA